MLTATSDVTCRLTVTDDWCVYGTSNDGDTLSERLGRVESTLSGNRRCGDRHAAIAGAPCNATTRIRWPFAILAALTGALNWLSKNNPYAAAMLVRPSPIGSHDTAARGAKS